ncbi:MAG: Asp-tRNA(Asn)/Glu-tRNA(Gln) amidotransferase subunit GatC [Candidatus Paceibacterota bacterium]|jgi:aspartyl-tRNA(Asn)/glutamyl-tRNA(Gln) amidotransferase subunit C
MISEEEIRNIAKLSNIEIKDDEIEEMREKFSSILEYIKKLQELDVSNIEETASVIKLESVMRDDVPHEGIIASFSREKDGCLEVNKILYNED